MCYNNGSWNVVPNCVLIAIAILGSLQVPSLSTPRLVLLNMLGPEN